MRADKNIGRNPELVAELRDHSNGERPSPIEHFGDAGAGSDDVNQVTAAKTRLFQPKQNRVDWIRRVDGVVFCLVGIDERDEHFQFIGIPCPWPCPPQMLNLAQRLGVVAGVSYRMNVHRANSPTSS